MTNTAVNPSIDSLSPIVWNAIPVVTTDLLAQLYGTEAVRIRQNYDRNTDRFVEGKHFFKLEGEQLRAFKHRVSKSDSVSIARNVRSLTLWTERGAARHAKMLETDQAWEVFEKLEDSYFQIKKEQTASSSGRSKALPNGLTVDQQDAIKKLVKARVDELPQDQRAKAAITCWSALKSHFGCSYKEISPEKFTDAISLVARQVLVGELVEPEALQSAELNIDYPLRRWVEENPAMKHSAGWSGESSVLITARMLCGTESRSPTLQLLTTLAEAGYNVEAYVVEVQSLRHHIGMMSNRIRQIASDCEDTISRGLRSKLH
jgi:hypothetical protein